MAASKICLASGVGGGKLLKYQPATGELTKLMGGLYYANGVALSPDQSSVMVIDTTSQTIHRHWLTGPKTGSNDVFFGGIPGAGDNMLYSKETNSYWVAVVFGMPSMRLMYTIARSKLLTQIMTRLPPKLLPRGKRFGGVLELDLDGNVKRAFFDMDGSHVATVSSALVKDSKLYMGNIGDDYVSILDLKA